MFYKGNGNVCRLVTFPSKSLEKEWGLNGFDVRGANILSLFTKPNVIHGQNL